MKPSITVLVCAYNDESTIGAVLEGVMRLSYQPLEVLVINDASTDSTRSVIEKYPVLAIHNSVNQGLGFNQNLGLKMAKGEYLAMVQSDCEILQPEWLDQMLEVLTGDVAVAVSQREIADFASLPAGARLFNAVAPQDLINNTGKPKELQFCRGKADLYRTDVLRELNGWDKTFFTAGEDTDLSIRMRKLGNRILLHPQATVRYLFSGRQVSIKGALKKAFLYGKTAFPLYRLHRYDGIQSRTYLILLLSAATLTIPSAAVQLILGLTWMIYSFTCRIQTKNGPGISLGFLGLIASLPMLMLHFWNKFPEIASIPAMAIAAAAAVYTGYLAAKNTIRNYRKGEYPGRLPGTFFFCIAWRLISGAGYLAGAIESLGRKKTLEKHESFVDQSA